MIHAWPTRLASPDMPQLIECIRKLAIVCLPVFFQPAGSVSQLIFGLMVCFLTFGAYMVYAPYAEQDDDYLAQLCQVQIFFSLVSSITLKYDAVRVLDALNAGPQRAIGMRSARSAMLHARAACESRRPSPTQPTSISSCPSSPSCPSCSPSIWRRRCLGTSTSSGGTSTSSGQRCVDQRLSPSSATRGSARRMLRPSMHQARPLSRSGLASVRSRCRTAYDQRA